MTCNIGHYFSMSVSYFSKTRSTTAVKTDFCRPEIAMSFLTIEIPFKLKHFSRELGFSHGIFVIALPPSKFLS